MSQAFHYTTSGDCEIENLIAAVFLDCIFDVEGGVIPPEDEEATVANLVTYEGALDASARQQINAALQTASASAPASASASGVAGDIAFDGSYFYVCIATNTWKRALLASW